MNQGSNNYAAPFGNLATGSTISNLTVANSNFTADKWVAGLTCKNSGTITNCTVGAKFVLSNSVNQQYYGGIVGYNYGASPVSGCLCYSTDVTSNLNFFKILIGRSYNNGDVVTNNYYRPVGNYGHGAPEASTTHVRAVSGIPSGVTSPHLCVSHGGYGYFLANTTITLTAPAHKIFTSDFSASGTGSSYTLSGDKTTATVTIATSDVTVNATVIFGPDFIENSDGSYTIKNANGWSVFCDLLEENAKGYFDGKTMTLGNSIGTAQNPVTRMAGSDGHDFTGTFNGNKKTLTVGYSGASYVAPFRYVDGATIQNLVVEGTISSSSSRAAGVIGETGSTGTTATSHITNCVSSSTISGGNYTGGFSIGGNVEIEGCVFCGKINGSSLSGGFVGYSNSTLKIKNSLFAPQSGSSISGGTFYYNGDAGTLTNCYYTPSPSGGWGAAQGKAARSVTAGDQYVTTCTVSPTGNSTDTYDLSGITAYNDGIVRDDTFYYGNGDHVSLTLAHSGRVGYTFNSYAPSAGTLNGTTLTMPNADVTIGCTWTANTYAVTLDGQGATASGTTEVTATYDAAMPAITVPTRTGYTFGGYYTATNGGGTKYYNADGTSARTCDITADTKFYAKWTPIDYTIIKGSSLENLNYTAHYEFAQITQGALSFVCTSGTEAKVTGCDPSTTLVTIPATVSNNDGTYNVTAIDATAFSSCTSLLVVILESDTPPTLGSGAFSACTALYAIGVPAGTAETYKAKWSDYAEKIYAIDGTCGTNVYYAYNSTTKTLNIFGTGAMADYPDNNRLWNGYRKDITTIVIGNGVATIGDNVFRGFTSLKSITIPTSVTSIGYAAFSGCTGQTSIEIPASVKFINYGAFSGCTGLESISVAAGNTIYDSRDNCNAIIETESNTLITGCKTTVIPASVRRIDYDAFYGCTSLESFEIPASVTEINNFAFYGCTSLSSVTIYALRLDHYGSRAFDNNADSRKIYVFENRVNTYKSGWSNYASDIKAITDINLKDAADNSSLIAAASGNSLNVTLQGRTLWKDGDWNTLCLPFDVSTTSGPLSGDNVEAMVLDGDESGLQGTTLTLNFDNAPATIPAGTPFIIRWGTPQNNLGTSFTDPVFSGVTVSDATNRDVNFTGGSFKGTYASITYDDEDPSILFLGTENTLYWPKPSGDNKPTIGAQRAYFELDDPEAPVRQFVLNFGEDGETQGITTTDSTDSTDKAGAWYTLDGMRLDEKPTKKGLYIMNGKKVVVH